MYNICNIFLMIYSFQSRLSKSQKYLYSDLQLSEQAGKWDKKEVRLFFFFFFQMGLNSLAALDLSVTVERAGNIAGLPPHLQQSLL